MGLSFFISLPVASYEVTDSFGKHYFEQPPQRVIVTDWTLLEQLLALGITPIAAPELDGYRKLVTKPALPEGIIDIGLRRSPNIKKIKALEPDLIILGTDQKDFDRPFSRISRVMYYQNFSDRFPTSNAEKSQQRLQQLAVLFQREQQAADILKQIHHRFDELRLQLKERYGAELPKITVSRLISHNTALVYGGNSMVGYALAMLGIESEITVNKNKLGERRLGFSEFDAIQEGYLFYVVPSKSAALYSNNKTWQALPVVKKEQAIELLASWPYGGAMSLLYQAEAIVDVLVALD